MSEDFIEVAQQSQVWIKEDGGTIGAALTSESGAYQAPHTDEPATGGIIYMTTDNPDTLTELRPNITYIIDELVGCDRHQGICYKKAIERGMRTAKWIFSSHEPCAEDHDPMV